MKFANEYRRGLEVLFSRLVRARGFITELSQLEFASKNIIKRNQVVLVDSDFSYGNVRALALSLSKYLPANLILFIAYDQKSLEWARLNHIPAATLSLEDGTENSEVWDFVLRAKVAVYDGHPWWRSQEQAVLNSLLSGALKIQLWHGATGPVGKAFGLERLVDSKSLWHFVEISSSSVGFDYLVNEPKFAESRRITSINATQTINDIEHRLVGYVDSWQKPHYARPKILVAPTYPESIANEDNLVKWVTALHVAAQKLNWDLTVNLHPGSKSRVKKSISKLNVAMTSVVVDSSDLKEYSVLVTDFSGIAHDALMIGLPTVSVLTFLDDYQVVTRTIIDEDQMNAAYVVQNLDELESQIHLAVTSDPKSEERLNYIRAITSAIGGLKGEPTVKQILELLEAN